MTNQSSSKYFNLLNKLVKPYHANGRTESASFLIWFLETIYRLDSVDAHDAVCDSRLDAGIDALTVNPDHREVVLFQAKRKEKLPATLGDKDLKSFVGSLAQFKDSATVKKMLQTTENVDLKRLLASNDVPGLLEQGYTIRPIFIANIAANEHASDYIAAVEKAGTPIDLWDLARFTPVLDQLHREWFVKEPATLHYSEGKLFVKGKKSDPSLVYAAIPAKELVKLPGITDTRLFAQNVRLGLNKTRVNNEIIKSVRNKSEHPFFLTFHNGLTIVAKGLSVRGSKIRITDYSVCNGCQSMLIFYENRKYLTDEMEILVRAVRIADDRSIAESIAYRTNNQNSISLRDLRSNADAQVQLKAEFDKLFGFAATYSIKRGETIKGEELSNEYAGQLLLALYLCKPWSAHQKFRIFGDLVNDIFQYTINASNIRIAQLMMKEVQSECESIAIDRIKKYALTKFIVLYVVGELLRKAGDGKKLLDDPLPFLATIGSANVFECQVLDQIRHLAQFAVTEINYFVAENGNEAYDFKSEFKSQTKVQTIRNEVLKSYEKDIYRKKVAPFVAPK